MLSLQWKQHKMNDVCNIRSHSIKNSLCYFGKILRNPQKFFVVSGSFTCAKCFSLKRKLYVIGSKFYLKIKTHPHTKIHSISSLMSNYLNKFVTQEIQFKRVAFNRLKCDLPCVASPNTEMIELFGHFLWQTSLHFSVWMHSNCSVTLNMCTLARWLWESLSSSWISTREKKSSLLAFGEPCGWPKGICRLLTILPDHFFSEFVSHAVASWEAATSYSFGHQTSMCKSSWFCVSRLIEHFKIHCFICDIDTPSHKNVTFFICQCCMDWITHQCLYEQTSFQNKLSFAFGYWFDKSYRNWIEPNMNAYLFFFLFVPPSKLMKDGILNKSCVKNVVFIILELLGKTMSYLQWNDKQIVV